jgi:hypothetical protein
MNGWWIIPFAWLITSSVHAGRVALVIGNNRYVHGAALENPVNDARAVKLALEKTGFDVVMGTDLGHEAMEKVVLDFSNRAKKAEAALFYYAGHGLELAGSNYLVPVDANVEAEWQVKHRTLALDGVLGGMREADAKVRIVILDCCRDNPLGRSWKRSAGRGLAAPEVPDGMVVVYAAGQGQVAVDGDGANSPFTQALVKHLSEPGLEIEQVFKRVGQSVVADTGGRQRPALYQNFYGSFVFVPRSGAAAPEPAVARADDRERSDGADLDQKLEEMRKLKEELERLSTSQREGAPDRDRAAPESPAGRAESGWQDSGYFYPMTGTRLVGRNDLSRMDSEDVKLAINEMFARHGAEFGDALMRKKFEATSWYRPVLGRSFDDAERQFNYFEKENLKLLVSHRAQLGAGGSSPAPSRKKENAGPPPRPAPASGFDSLDDY